MKNLFFALIIFAIALTGCSGDDDNNQLSFTSSVKIDDRDFALSHDKNKTFLHTTLTPASNQPDSENVRLFTIQKETAENPETAQLAVAVRYPRGATIDGTYLFELAETAGNRFGNGNYYTPAQTYSFAGYSVTVSDLGNSKYKLTFNNVQAVYMMPNNTVSEPIIISGTFEGTFVEIPFEE
jgi:hypothetical protein